MIKETDIGPSSKGKNLPPTKVVQGDGNGGKSSSKSAKGKSGKVALGKAARSDMYQGASGTWYQNGRKVYAGDPGPQMLKHPEAVQKAYKEKLARDEKARGKGKTSKIAKRKKSPIGRIEYT